MKKLLATLAAVAAMFATTASAGGGGAATPTDTLSRYISASVDVTVYGTGLTPGARYDSSWIADFEGCGDCYATDGPHTANRLGVGRFSIPLDALAQCHTSRYVDTVSMWIRDADTDYWAKPVLDVDGNMRDITIHLR